MAANTGCAVTQAMILAPFPLEGKAQAMADIKTPKLSGFGQAMTSVVKFAKQVNFAQAQGRINNPYHLSQAQAYIIQGA